MPPLDLQPDSESSLHDLCLVFSSDENTSLPTTPEINDEKGGGNPTAYSPNHAARSPAQGAPLVDCDFPVALGAIRVRRDSQSALLTLDRCVCVAGRHTDTPFPWPNVDILVERGWMQTDVVENRRNAVHYSVRISVIAEDSGRHSRKSSMIECRKLLKHILSYIDKSKCAWDGDWSLNDPFESYLTCPEQESLFFIFNTLPSPSPSTESVADQHTRCAMEDVLDNNVSGLQTTLYSYQQRSAAMMIQRETVPRRSPDPRKPCFFGPTGQSFYYDKEEGILLLRPSLYEEPRGGILAETMGYGKTLICLTVILASKGHYSQVPDDRMEVPQRVRQDVASLAEMAAAKVIAATVPWKAEFYDLAAKGYHHDRCVELLKSSRKEYTERLLTPRTPNRNGKRRTEKGVRLCSTTLIIVPPNLLTQWQHEIEKHTEKGALDVLVIDRSCKVIPHRDQLALHDIVLIAKGRLDQEYRDDDLNTGRRRRDGEQYQSPLTDLRWLRVILDEGAGFSSTPTKTNAMAMLEKMYFDRRWVVSGTPSNSLRGVEVGLAANATMSGEDTGRNDLQTTLEKRRKSDVLDREGRDLDKLRMIITRFLKAPPWANSPGSDHANWSRYLAPFDNSGRRRNVTGLRALLESVMVRHTIEDIEADLTLPPLHNRVTYLEPSFHDKLSINLFNAVLVTNAVTSERTDEDYMFHPRNRKPLDLLINNLRQSSFHWVGFTKHDIEETVRTSKGYLEKHAHRILSKDCALLRSAIESGERAITHAGWLAFSTLHEIGVYVENFPEHASEAWALGQPSEPLLMGTVQARMAQQYIEQHVGDDDPAEGLPGAGLRAMQAAGKRAADENKTTAKARAAGSQVIEEPKIKDQTRRKRSLSASSADTSPAKKRAQADPPPQEQPQPYSPLLLLPPSSPLHRTRIVGFTSSKLTYLISQIQLHQTTSKILIFYDTNNVAFWIAEALELLSLPFLIYANTLPQTQRSHYLSLFNHRSPDPDPDPDPDDEAAAQTDSRNNSNVLLLMDLRQASHGLHIAAANRIYIVSPIWQPHIEAQAIKRAHRIGQGRAVWVETLVLRGTLEERMLLRRREMSHAELRRAERSLLDDGVMGGIIREGGFLAFEAREEEEEEDAVEGQVARLAVPRKLFGHSWRDENE